MCSADLLHMPKLWWGQGIAHLMLTASHLQDPRVHSTVKVMSLLTAEGGTPPAQNRYFEVFRTPLCQGLGKLTKCDFYVTGRTAHVVDTCEHLVVQFFNVQGHQAVLEKRWWTKEDNIFVL